MKPNVTTAPGHISSPISLYEWVMPTSFVSDQCTGLPLLFLPDSFYSSPLWRKLAKKRKETLNSTRQEMTVMVNSMDKSYTEQGTNCDEALSFMDTHNHTLNTRSECALTLNGRSECALTLNGRGKAPSRQPTCFSFFLTWSHSQSVVEAIYLVWSGGKEIRLGCTGNVHPGKTLAPVHFQRMLIWKRFQERKKKKKIQTRHFYFCLVRAGNALCLFWLYKRHPYNRAYILALKLSVRQDTVTFSQ